MNDYEFTLKFRLPESGKNPEEYIAALADAGCDDALVGVGRPGRIALDFTRTATSATDAIVSALKDVRKAIPKAELVEASPDFVGLTDVAEIAGCTRQNMRKLMTTHLASFPAPVHDGSSAVWHLATVLRWLHEKQQRSVDVTLLEVAKINMALNIAKERAAIPNADQKKFTDLLMLAAAT